MAPQSAGAVGRSFFKLGMGEALARVLGFLATIYLARLLGAQVYGMIVLAAAILLYATCLTEGGVDMLGVHDVARNPAELPGLLRDLLGARLFVAGCLLALLVAAGLLLFPQPDGSVVAAYALLLLPIALGTRWAHLGMDRSGSVALSRVLCEGLAALLIVVLIHGAGDVGRAPLAQFLGEAAAALLLLRLLPRGSLRLPIALRFEVLRSLFRRSWPVVGHTLLGLLLFNCDFFFLRVYGSSATVGYYAVAYSLVSFFLNLGSSYALSLLPVITRLREQPAAERDLYQSAMAHVFAGALPVAIGGCLLADRLVLLMFGAGYALSGTPLRILAWCIPVALFRNVTQSALVARGRQDQLLRTVVWAAGLNLALNAVLIPLYGMVGAAVATVLTEAVRTVLALRYCRLAGLSFTPLRRFWRSTVAGGVMTAVLTLGGINAWWLALALGAAVYGVTLYLVGGVKVTAGTLPELTV